MRRFPCAIAAVAVCVVATFVSAQPRLEIIRQGTNVVISWAITNSTNFILQKTSAITNDTWSNVTPAPTTNAGNKFVTVTPTNPAVFFRLLLDESLLVDDPDDSFIDSNNDGIDGTVAKAIFVAPTGDDSKAGTMTEPMKTIAAALLKATVQGKIHVYVAQGVYTAASLTLVSGISIYGGYNALDWSRANSNVTQFSASSVKAVVATGVSSPTTLDHLQITSTDAKTAGESSYGIFAVNSSGLIVRRCRITSGNGAEGTPGGDGDPGDEGFPVLPDFRVVRIRPFPVKLVRVRRAAQAERPPAVGPVEWVDFPAAVHKTAILEVQARAGLWEEMELLAVGPGGAMEVWAIAVPAAPTALTERPLRLVSLYLLGSFLPWATLERLVLTEMEVAVAEGVAVVTRIATPMAAPEVAEAAAVAQGNRAAVVNLAVVPSPSFFGILPLALKEPCS